MNIVKAQAEASVTRIIWVLESPRLQADRKNPVVMNLRRAMIAQIFWLDRVIASIRDREAEAVIREYVENGRLALERVRKAMPKFLEYCRNNQCRGK